MHSLKSKTIAQKGSVSWGRGRTGGTGSRSLFSKSLLSPASLLLLLLPDWIPTLVRWVCVIFPSARFWDLLGKTELSELKHNKELNCCF